MPGRNLKVQRPDLSVLVDESFRLYQESPKSIVLDKSIPVIYFGDFDAYWQSSPRVVTVGRNRARARAKCAHYSCLLETARSTGYATIAPSTT